MARLKWTTQAVEDIDAICTFIARDAPRTAKRFGQELFNAPQRLERFPLSGSPVPEVRDGLLREIRVRRYRIIYRILEEKTVEILTVHHGARLLDVSMFDGE